MKRSSAAAGDDSLVAELAAARTALKSAEPGSADFLRARVRLYELLQQYLETVDDDPGLSELEDESITVGRSLLADDLDTATRRLVEVSLSVDLIRRYRRLGPGAVDDLDHAISLGRRRVEAEDDATWVTDRVNLAGALLTSWNDRDRVDHLDEAVPLLETALADDGIDAEGRSFIAVTLAAAYINRFDLARRAEDLRSAIRTLRSVLTEHVPSTFIGAIINLVNALLTAHETGVDVGDPLDEAVALIEKVSATSGGGPRSSDWRYAVARVRLAQFDHGGDGEHLDQADTALSEALALLDDDSPDRSSYVSTAAVLAFARYSHGGNRRHLETAISATQEARSLDGISPQDLAILANQTCLAMTERFHLDGNRDDLDQAISLGREALNSSIRLDVEGALRVNLAHALHQRFELTGARRDLTEAIVNAVSALRVRTPSPERAIALSTAGLLYESKAQMAQADGDAHIAQADLDQAIGYIREALSFTSDQSPDAVTYRTHLASWLSSRAELTGSETDLDDAISHYETALDQAPEDSVTAGLTSFNLACCYASRVDRDVRAGGRAGQRSRNDLQRACDLWDDALAAGQPFISQFAGQRLGEVAFRMGEWDKCEQALTFSLDAARALTARRPRLADRERARFAVQGAASLAAVAATRAGSPQRAVVHLEQASATLLAEAAGLPADTVHFDEIVEAARHLGGPLVYWAATDYAGLSLIVTPDGSVTPVPLQVTIREAAKVIEELRAAFAANPTDTEAQLDEWNAAVEDVLRWTWENFVSHVVGVLGAVDTVGLIPIGRLAALPLSTARVQTGLYELTVPCVLPNARSVRRAPAWPATPRAAVVCDAGKGDDHLPAITSEGVRVAACYAQADQFVAASEAGAAPPRRVLRRSEVSAKEPAAHPVSASADVADELIGYLNGIDVGHIACHFSIKFDDPFDSVLHFKSGVRLAEIFGRHLPDPVHLVLSACDSGLSGTRLPDEAIGPASLLLASGARSVLAALWPLDDATAPDFMTEYHRRLASGHAPATALALTQRAVSLTSPTALWPAFVHVGT
ncbi:CHAT domain-containing protein [Actinomadura sp. LD22]|uniref:CHAT domain-containing protein n=1 Tax=Actinomadura physcomitrii TaxID=2650748 RepID=A0A6I4MBY5_9ACTN|nr:CHAT domain-containing protein [Actinomadura physcomitrii]MWA03302.1 CHAT domain-containing protein [Actinomadura physcomitrii]